MRGSRQGPGLVHGGPTALSPRVSSEMKGTRPTLLLEFAQRCTRVTVSAQPLEFEGSIPSVPLSSTLTDLGTGIWGVEGLAGAHSQPAQGGIQTRPLWASPDPVPPSVSQYHVTVTL